MHRTRISACLLTVVFAFGITGCATRKVYMPSADRQFEPIPEFSSSNSVALLNAQPSNQEVEFTKQGVFTWVANLKEWTGVAITIAQRQLEKRGLQTSDGSQRQLSISVVAVKTETNFLASSVETQVLLRVETAAGYSAEYTGKSKTYVLLNMARQIDYALMNTVVELLSDPKIVSYLTN